MIRTILTTALLLTLTIGLASAQSAWPSDNSYVGYTLANASPIQDPNDVPNNQIEFDLIYGSGFVAPYTVQIATTTSSVFFRLQVRDITQWTVGTYLLFISDGNGTILGKTYLTLTGNAGSIHVVNAAGTVDQTTGSGSHATDIDGWARFVSITGSTHEYVDFQLPRSTFESVLGISGQILVKFYAGTSTGAGNVNNINTDWMTSSTNSQPTASDFATLSTGTLDDIGNGALPVELTSFSAYLKSGIVSLRWNTATETNNFGFEIERRSADGEWTVIGFVPGAGNSSSPKAYTHEDDASMYAGSISYRLKQIDRDGTTEYSSTVMVNNTSATVSMNAYPNPFNPSTTVNFTLSAESNVRLVLVDVTGREVLTVIDGTQLGAGSHSQTINADGLPSGRYFIVMQSAEGRSVYPVLLSK
ncbi:MAG: T9SS type A sorting domain-containing protein [Bacteroidetes bacterium]|nr:T9SS type A sorting domain-containing protein [Bacteroidota bacterium]